jgi:hypothetical protein
MSPLAYAIWVSFKYNPNDWEGYDDAYRIRHKINGTLIWCGSGRWYFNIEHNNSHRDNTLLGFFDRHLVFNAFLAAQRDIRRGDKSGIRAEYLCKFTSNKNKP